MRRIITLAILIIVNFTLQTTAFSFHNMRGITPNLLLILTMSFGLMRGRKEGLLVGFFSGFLCDCYFSSILGGYMFLYMFVGYTNGLLHKNYMIEDVSLPLVMITIDELFFNISIYVVHFLLQNHLEFGSYLAGIILPETLFTAILTIFMYKIFVFINKQLKDKAEGRDTL